MKQKPRWTLEMLAASLAVLCGLLVLLLLILWQLHRCLGVRLS